MSMRPATCQVCAYYAVGIVSSEPCICGPNVECQKEPPCAVAMNASAAPSPAWLTEHTAVVEGRTLYAAVLAGLIEWAGEAADLEDCRSAARHLTPIVRAHVTAALAAEAEKGGA